MEYDNYTDDIKKFINKAIDIYNLIKNNKIELKKNITSVDKKILSIYISGLIYNGKVDRMLYDYVDFDYEDLLKIVKLTDKDLTSNKLDNNNYKDIYNKQFEPVFNFLLGDNKYNSDNFIETILYNSFSQDIIIKLTEKLGFNDYLNSPLYEKLMDDINSDNNDSKDINIIKSDKERYFDVIDINNDELWKIEKDIEKKYIGQEKFVDDLFCNIIKNQILIQNDNLNEDTRSLIFVDGPSGTGKTAITRDITKGLGLPFTASSVTNYSATGYEGASLVDNLNNLYMRAYGDMDLAERGIVVLDEFDKLAYSGDNSLEMKRGVQQELLDFLGGGKYSVADDEFDTSKLTFVCLGALTNLRKNKTEKKKSIGFQTNEDNTEKKEYEITPDDLIKLGIEKELVARINTYLHTNDYDKETLKKILIDSSASPLKGIIDLANACGKKVIIDSSVYDLIANKAYDLNFGARSLHTVVDTLSTNLLHKILKSRSKVIRIDYDTVKSIIDENNIRRVRK